MKSSQTAWTLRLKVEDIILEKHSKIQKHHIGYFVFVGTALVDVLVFPERGCTNAVQIAISPTSEIIKIVAKT